VQVLDLEKSNFEISKEMKYPIIATRDIYLNDKCKLFMKSSLPKTPENIEKYSCPKELKNSRDVMCDICPAGTYQIETEEGRICQKCEKGYYQSLTGQVSCKKCPIGTFTDTTGATECTQCPNGYFTETKASDHRDDCQNCNAGTKLSSEGTS